MRRTFLLPFAMFVMGVCLIYVWFVPSAVPGWALAPGFRRALLLNRTYEPTIFTLLFGLAITGVGLTGVVARFTGLTYDQSKSRPVAFDSSVNARLDDFLQRKRDLNRSTSSVSAGRTVMPIFGRKARDHGQEQRTRYPETLDVTNLADVTWIRQSNDALVWHAAALACLIFRGDPHELIAWLVEQPTLGRVTAAAMFLHRDNGLRRLRGEDVEFVHMEAEQVERMIDRLCELDRTRALRDHGIGMDSGWEQARLETLANISRNERAPWRLLEGSIDRQSASMPYSDIGEGELVSDAYMRREMPFLFD